VVYKLTNSGGTWTQTVIHAFTGGDDGSGPGARVTLDRSGNVYGMAPTGGAYGLGTIYKIYQEHNGTWNLTVIHAFTVARTESQAQLEEWFCAMAVSLARLLPATLMEAELFSSLGPRVAESGISGRFIRSEGQPDGSFPYGALLFDRVGNTYGTTYYGGANGIGSVYELSPVLSANGTRACSIASKKEATAIAPSAIVLLTASAICVGLRVRVAWVVALSLS
jgi:uncharacterized repeat protein (TIGR03803 family)